MSSNSSTDSMTTWSVNSLERHIGNALDHPNRAKCVRSAETREFAQIIRVEMKSDVLSVKNQTNLFICTYSAVTHSHLKLIWRVHPVHIIQAIQGIRPASLSTRLQPFSHLDLPSGLLSTWAPLRRACRRSLLTRRLATSSDHSQLLLPEAHRQLPVRESLITKKRR